MPTIYFHVTDMSTKDTPLKLKTTSLILAQAEAEKLAHCRIDRVVTTRILTK